jgi:hypothetical protein
MTYSQPISKELARRLTLAGMRVDTTGSCPGCTWDPRYGGAVSQYHTEECHRKYKRCPVCGAEHARCLHGRCKPADEACMQEFPTAAYHRWCGDYTLQGCPMWAAYDSEYRHLGDYRRGRPPEGYPR